jgi:hypothetical protein
MTIEPLAINNASCFNVHAIAMLGSLQAQEYWLHVTSEVNVHLSKMTVSSVTKSRRDGAIRACHFPWLITTSFQCLQM